MDVKRYFTQQKIWLIPLLVALFMTPFTPLLDLGMARYFYNGHFVSNSLTESFYTTALIPGQMVTVLALFILLLSYVMVRARKWRLHALYLILTLALGAGFITHTLLKDNWGRPRPRQVIEFGGIQEFRPLWKPNFFHQPEPSKAFPCGHCTMGFFFFTFIFLGRRFKKPLLWASGLFLSLFLGIGIGLSRIAQGGHFFSDVLFSALIMWLTAAAMDWLLYEEHQ